MINILMFLFWNPSAEKFLLKNSLGRGNLPSMVSVLPPTTRGPSQSSLRLSGSLFWKDVLSLVDSLYLFSSISDTYEHNKRRRAAGAAILDPGWNVFLGL